MHKKHIWVVISLLLIVSMLSAFVVSCGEDEETTTPPTTPPLTTPAADWWETMWGEPEYGGTMVYRAGFLDVIADPLDPRSSQFGAWLEALFMDDMTVNRQTEFGFDCNFFPLEYRAGQLAESWEQTDPTTITVHLREGVVWQNKPPTNGRAFTADDVAFTYNKVLGTGEFAGQPGNPFLSSLLPNIASVEATDATTAVFHLKAANPFAAYDIVDPWMSIIIAPREWYDLTDEQKADWHNVPGIGAFVLTDFVSGTSMTCTANPDYYGVDARYGEQLPYLDEVKILVIPDMDTALSALRTGEIDMLVDARTYPSLAQTQMLAQTNPEIHHYQQAVMAPGLFFHWNQDTASIDAPFDDINVRKAMQLAIDNATIAATYYQGTVDGVPGGLMALSAGDWSIPFADWPAALQAEYSYNLTEAQALMAGVGTIDAEVLTTPTDFPDVLELWQGMLSEIGINLTINAMDMMAQRPVVQAGDFELLWVSIAASTNSSPGDAIKSFYSQKFERVGQGGGVVDPAYDAIVEDFLAATTVEDAAVIFKEADQYWLEQHWAVIGFPSWSHQFAQPWIESYQGERFWSTNTWAQIAHIWIDSAIKAEYTGE